MANKRIYSPQAVTINGVDAGGAMQLRIQAGYDGKLQSAPDGLGVPIKDKHSGFCRGTLISQDWPHIVDLLTGTVGTLVCYERESGAATYTKHTITNPVIHRVALQFNKGQYATLAADFECRAALTTTDFTQMWTAEAGQTAPTYVSAARGGWRIESAVFSSLATEKIINHVDRFTFEIVMDLLKDSADLDLAYTAVDAVEDRMQASGSLGSQDFEVASGYAKMLSLIAASRDNLVLEISQSGSAANKVVTIAGVDFQDAESDSNAEGGYSGLGVNFDVTNDATTPLSLSGDNKIITIADSA